MGIGKRVVLVIVVVGMLLTAAECYLLCTMPSIPKSVKQVKAILNSSENMNTAEQRLRNMMAKEKGLISVEIEGSGIETPLILEKELQSDAPVIKVLVPFNRGEATVGMERLSFFRQSIGYWMLLFGAVNIVVLSLVVLLMVQGASERLLSIADYLKEAELEELDELTMENWPPEVRQVVASIDILLKRMEKRLKLKVEEARRDRLFVHNAMVELVECLNQAAQGDLRVRAEVSADIVGALGEAFNDSVEVLEKRISDAQRLLNDLDQSLDDTEENERLKEEIGKAKRALLYFKTEVSRSMGPRSRSSAAEEPSKQGEA